MLSLERHDFDAAGLDHHFVYLPIEGLGAGASCNNGDPCVPADIKGFSHTGRDDDLSFNPSLCNDFAVEKYLHPTAFAGTAAIVLERKPQLVLTWG